MSDLVACLVKIYEPGGCGGQSAGPGAAVVALEGELAVAARRSNNAASAILYRLTQERGQSAVRSLLQMQNKSFFCVFTVSCFVVICYCSCKKNETNQKKLYFVLFRNQTNTKIRFQHTFHHSLLYHLVDFLHSSVYLSINVKEFISKAPSRHIAQYIWGHRQLFVCVSRSKLPLQGFRRGLVCFQNYLVISEKQPKSSQSNITTIRFPITV